MVRLNGEMFFVFTGSDELRLLAITVATDETDGYKRFMRSAKNNNIDVKVFFNYSCLSYLAISSVQNTCMQTSFSQII